MVNNPIYNEKMNSIKNFGTNNGSYEYVGINAKNSEFHAAMGICVLNHIDSIINSRKHVYEKYTSMLKNIVRIPKIPDNFEYNYIYYPVLFESEEQLLRVFEELNKNEIFPRRYFYPCLNNLKIFKNNDNTPVANDVSKRIACLPMDTYLADEDIDLICRIIISTLKK